MIAVNALNIEKISLDDLGQSLPIGLWLPSGERLTEYVLHPYTGHFDLTLGRLEDSNRNHKRRLNRIYSEFLTQTVHSIGSYELPELANLLGINTIQLFEQMYLPDVISLLLNVRMTSYGSQIDINGVCPCPEQKLLKPGAGMLGGHDLQTVEVYKLPDYLQDSPPFTVELSTGEIVTIEPLRFRQLQDLRQLEGCIYLKILSLCSSVTDELFDSLSLDDIVKLKKAALCMEKLGPDKAIEMDCYHPQCPHGGGIEWTSYLILGENYEDFYLSFVSSPRMDAEIGGTERYFNELGFFLATGQDSPNKSILEVRDYTPISREQITQKLIEFYKQREEQMKEAEAKAKSKNSRSRRV